MYGERLGQFDLSASGRTSLDPNFEHCLPDPHPSKHQLKTSVARQRSIACRTAGVLQVGSPSDVVCSVVPPVSDLRRPEMGATSRCVALSFRNVFTP
jgi:hypothetical protein